MTTNVSSPSKGQRKRAADFTGLQGERLAAEKAAEAKDAAQHLSMVTATQQEISTATIDFTTGEVIDEVETRSVEVNSPTRTIRVNADIEDMTWGRQVVDPGDLETGRPAIMGPLNNHTFREGQSYKKVPVELAMHLNRLGYLSYLGD